MSGVVQGFTRASGGVLPRIAGGLLSIPVTTAFVLLGVAVVLGRGVRRVVAGMSPVRATSDLVDEPRRSAAA
jgi:hypothetical protein